MSDIGDIAQAVTWIGKIVYETLHKTKQDLIQKAYSDAERDVEDFANELLDITRDVEGARTRAQLMLDGLVFGIKVNITADNAELLRRSPIGKELDLYDLLGLYARGRGAEFCKKVNEIMEFEKKDL